MQFPDNDRDTSPLIALLATIIQFGIVGFVGSVPLGLITAFIYGPIIGREIWLLGAILMGSYFPLRTLLSRIFKQTGVIDYFPKNLNLNLLVIAAFGFLFMTPLVWFMTFSALIAGIVTYAILGQNIWLALIVALGLHTFNIYRQNQNTITYTASFSGNFQDFFQNLQSDNTLVLDDDNVDVYVTDDDDDELEDTYLEEGVIYHLPETTDRQPTLKHEDEEIIIIDPDSDTQQQDEQ